MSEDSPDDSLRRISDHALAFIVTVDHSDYKRDRIIPVSGTWACNTSKGPRNNAFRGSAAKFEFALSMLTKVTNNGVQCLSCSQSSEPLRVTYRWNQNLLGYRKLCLSNIMPTIAALVNNGDRWP